MDPEFALAQADLGMHYYMVGDGERGEQHFKQALKVVDRLTLREKLWINAVVEDWRGDRDGAIRSYETYLSQYADDQGAWFRLGYTNMIMGNFEKATTAFNKAIELNPSDASSFVNLATIVSTQGDHEKALTAYEKAFALQPQLLTEAFVNNEYGFLLVKMGRIPQAIETFQKMFASKGPDRLRSERAEGGGLSVAGPTQYVPRQILGSRNAAQRGHPSEKGGEQSFGGISRSSLSRNRLRGEGQSEGD